LVNSTSSPAAWATAIALALGCRSQGSSSSAAPGGEPTSKPTSERTDGRAEKAESMSASSSASSAPLVGPPSLIPWSRLGAAQVVDVAAPSGGAFEVPGPRQRPVRPWLELASSPAGVAARLVQGDGTTAAVALRGDQVVPIGAGALAVSARGDGLWVMYRDHLVHHDAAGVERRRVELAAVAMVGAPDDAVWLASNDQAWHVDAAGAVRGPYAWAQPLASFALGAELCARDKRDARALRCLAPDGAEAPRQLAFELAPLEQPLRVDGERVLTLQGVTVRLRRGAELVATLTLQGAGLDAAGRGFAIAAEAAGATGAAPGAVAGAATEWVLWQQATAAGGSLETRRFPRVGGGGLGAAAVNGEQVMLYGQGQVALHRRGAPGELAAVDEAEYRQAIFPQGWVLSPRSAVAVAQSSDGAGLVVATSGPTGVALVPVSVGQ
jgi:hypothetical protein